MWQHVDRGVGEEIDVIGAAGQRRLDIAAREGIEQVHDALAIQLLHRHSRRSRSAPLRSATLTRGLADRQLQNLGDVAAVLTHERNARFMACNYWLSRTVAARIRTA